MVSPEYETVVSLLPTQLQDTFHGSCFQHFILNSLYNRQYGHFVTFYSKKSSMVQTKTIKNHFQ